MTEFTETLRHYCRNPRCRSKLPAPVANPREAFCTRGCYGSFYLRRCLACEGPIDRKRADQKVCRKAKCRSALRGGNDFGCYAGTSPAKLASKTPDFIDPKMPLRTEQPWRVVAGPKLSSSALRCATIGGGEAVEAINRTNLRHWRGAEAGCSIKRHDAPVNVLGGHKFPGAPIVDLAPIAPPSLPPANDDSAVNYGESLDIPEFLRRTASVPESEAA
jgi:hypothetical protein